VFRPKKKSEHSCKPRSDDAGQRQVHGRYTSGTREVHAPAGHATIGKRHWRSHSVLLRAGRRAGTTVRDRRFCVIGPDLAAGLLAPCWLGRAGTGRQNPASTSLCLAGLRYSSARRMISVTRDNFGVRKSSGLLIRGFGVQVPGGAPGLSRHYMCLLLLFSGVVGPGWVLCGTSLKSNATDLLFGFIAPCWRPGCRAG